MIAPSLTPHWYDPSKFHELCKHNFAHSRENSSRSDGLAWALKRRSRGTRPRLRFALWQSDRPTCASFLSHWLAFCRKLIRRTNGSMARFIARACTRAKPSEPADHVLCRTTRRGAPRMCAHTLVEHSTSPLRRGPGSERSGARNTNSTPRSSRLRGGVTGSASKALSAYLANTYNTTGAGLPGASGALPSRANPRPQTLRTPT